MILKKKEFFLLIFLVLLQSCSGGVIGNFLESSFKDFEKISQDEDLQENLENQKVVLRENKEINNINNEEIQKVEKNKIVLENKEINDKNNEQSQKVEKTKIVLENKEINDKNNEQSQKVEKTKIVLENKENPNLENKQKKEINKIKISSKDGGVELESYKIIFILKDVDPKDPTEELTTILSDSKVNFEIEKIERIIDTKK